MLLSVGQVEALLKMVDYCIRTYDWDQDDLLEAHQVRAELRRYLDAARGVMTDATEAYRDTGERRTLDGGGEG
jgi:hypothetical protein